REVRAFRSRLELLSTALGLERKTVCSAKRSSRKMREGLPMSSGPHSMGPRIRRDSPVWRTDRGFSAPAEQRIEPFASEAGIDGGPAGHEASPRPQTSPRARTIEGTPHERHSPAKDRPLG